MEAADLLYSDASAPLQTVQDWRTVLATHGVAAMSALKDLERIKLDGHLVAILLFE